MILPMRFIGEDGSMGYEYGKTYHLAIFPKWLGYRIIVEPLHHPEMRCPYRSLFTFLANWQRVERHSRTVKDSKGKG